MLKRGKFIKEPFPQIGKFWTYTMSNRAKSQEEHFVEALIRGDKVHTTTKVERLLAAMLKI